MAVWPAQACIALACPETSLIRCCNPTREFWNLAASLATLSIQLKLWNWAHSPALPLPKRHQESCGGRYQTLLGPWVDDFPLLMIVSRIAVE
jgi:hypothetical protein